MMHKNNKKGFTLAELLIVVAIIAVLVAIAIPVFTTQLERSRDAVTISNVRAAYAEAASEFLTSNGKAVGATTDHVYVAAPASDGSVSVTVNNIVVKGTNDSDLSNAEAELPFTLSAENIKALHKVTGDAGANGYVKITFKWAKDASQPTVDKIEAGSAPA